MSDGVNHKVQKGIVTNTYRLEQGAHNNFKSLFYNAFYNPDLLYKTADHHYNLSSDQTRSLISNYKIMTKDIDFSRLSPEEQISTLLKLQHSYNNKAKRISQTLQNDSNLQQQSGVFLKQGGGKTQKKQKQNIKKSSSPYSISTKNTKIPKTHRQTHTITDKNNKKKQIIPVAGYKNFYYYPGKNEVSLTKKDKHTKAGRPPIQEDSSSSSADSSSEEEEDDDEEEQSSSSSLSSSSSASEEDLTSQSSSSEEEDEEEEEEM
jgi:hypothetical protein